MRDDFDSEPMMAVPSPGAFSLSPKSQTESTASLSADQPSSLEEYPSFTACGLAIAMKVAETFSTDMASSDAAMALRTLAICGGTFRHAGIACAVMPLAESFGFISGGSRWIPDLQPPQYLWQDLLALTEHFVAGAMEDCTFIARDHEDGKPPTRREVEAMQKNRLEYWQGMLRNAHLGREMMPNPCREAVLAKMGFANDGIPEQIPKTVLHRIPDAEHGEAMLLSISAALRVRMWVWEAEATEWKIALALLEEMEEKSVEANAFTFSSTIKACERQGCWEAVSKLLLHMAENAVQGNSYTFNAAIGTFGKAQMWSMAMSLTKEMTIQQIQSDAITGSTLVGSLEPWPNSGRASFVIQA
eukprot:s185_g40.t1